MPKNFYNVLLVLCLLMGNTPAALAQDRFATVYKVHGRVTATSPASANAANNERELKPGDVLQVGEQIQAAAHSEAVLRTDDAGVIAVRPQAAFVMEQFKTSPAAGAAREDRFSLRLLAGTLRVITGLTAVRNRDGHKIVTPTATIGVRGTDHEPYVLGTELAASVQQAEGTYNKVNRGATLLEASGTALSVPAGAVGFAPTRSASRSLLTALLPVLLDKVPDFYLPGQYDAELAEYAARELSAAQNASLGAPTAPTAPTAPAPSPSSPPASSTPPSAAPIVSQASEVKSVPEPAHCRATDIARQWLEELDQAIYQRNAKAFIDKFSAKAKITTQVLDSKGQITESVFTRNEMARSAFSALRELSSFSTQRPSLSAWADSSIAGCKSINLESVVIESGVRAGQSYRLESSESFTLIRQGGRWLASEARSQQR